MTTMWKLNTNENIPLDNQIKIADDREAIRLLGAWIGNNTNVTAPWEPVVDKIHRSLTLYSKSHLTLNRRKTISQIIIGGYTQFLMKAQGMPPNIEKALIKIERDFIWEENTSLRIAIDYLYCTVEEGSLNLLDIHTRNEAIKIIWLKDYLNFSSTRPTWAKIADILIDNIALQNFCTQARINTFLQS